jgi:hypothetical protein
LSPNDESVRAGIGYHPTMAPRDFFFVAAAALLVVPSCVHGDARTVGGEGGSAAACGAPLTDCEGTCVDTQLSREHCGSCGMACAEGELCSVGQCGVECLGGTSQCGDRCVDLTVDPANCGDCDVACNSESTCFDSGCHLQCGGGPCEPGQHLWSRRLGNTANNYFHALNQDPAGNIYAAGYFEGAFDLGGGSIGTAAVRNVVLAKFDKDGNHLWSKAFGSNDGYGHDVALDASGNVILSGIFNGSIDFGTGPLTATGAYDAFVAKFDTDGNAIWNKRFGDTTDTRAHFVDVDASGNILLTGIFFGTVDFGNGPRTTAGSWDGYVAKFDPQGNVMWVRIFGDAADQRARGVCMGPGGEVIIVSQYTGSVSFGGKALTSAGEWDSYVAKLDPMGNELWSKSFGSADPEQYLFVCSADVLGNVFVAGQFRGSWDLGGGMLTSSGSFDGVVAKFGPNGDHVFSKRYGDENDQVIWGVAADGDGGVVINGHFIGTIDLGSGPITSAGSWDDVLAHLGPDGTPHWAKRFGDASHQVGLDVSVSSSGKIITTGYFQGAVDFGGGPLATAGGDDCWLAAFAP